MQQEPELVQQEPELVQQEPKLGVADAVVVSLSCVPVLMHQELKLSVLGVADAVVVSLSWVPVLLQQEPKLLVLGVVSLSWVPVLQEVVQQEPKLLLGGAVVSLSQVAVLPMISFGLGAFVKFKEISFIKRLLNLIYITIEMFWICISPPRQIDGLCSEITYREIYFNWFSTSQAKTMLDVR